MCVCMCVCDHQLTYLRVFDWACRGEAYSCHSQSQSSASSSYPHRISTWPAPAPSPAKHSRRMRHWMHAWVHVYMCVLTADQNCVCLVYRNTNAYTQTKTHTGAHAYTHACIRIRAYVPIILDGISIEQIGLIAVIALQRGVLAWVRHEIMSLTPLIHCLRLWYTRL